MQCCEWKPFQEKRVAQEALAVVWARCQEANWNPQQSKIIITQRETLKERKGKLEQVIYKQSQDLSELQEKKARAEKSLGLMQTNWNKKKI